MKHQLKHVASDTTRTIALERTADDADAFEAMIDGRMVPVDVQSIDGSAGRLRIGGRVHRYHFLRRDNALHVWIDGSLHIFERVDSTARRAGSTGAPAAASNQLTAPMPGTILKINGSAGDRFDAHAPIVVMESMKMEMSLSAPTDVTLSQVDCEVGQLVEMGALLAKLEPVPDGDA